MTDNPYLTRRTLLTAVGTTLLAGCSSDGGGGNRTPDVTTTVKTTSPRTTESPTTVSTDTTTTASTTTTTETTTEDTTTTVDPDHEAEFEVLNGELPFISVVSDENVDESTIVEFEITDSNGLKTAELTKPNGETVTKELEGEQDTARFEWKTVENPPAKGLGLKVTDENNREYQRDPELQTPNKGYRINLQDHSEDGSLHHESNYPNARDFDTITNTNSNGEPMTNQDWMEYYWNDEENMDRVMQKAGINWDQITTRFNEVRQEFGNSTDEKVKSIVKTLAEISLENEEIDTSGENYDLFYPGERRLAKEMARQGFGWTHPYSENEELENKFFTTNVRAGHGNHKVIMIAYENDQDDWQIRYHEPWRNGSRSWEDFYDKPENTPYREGLIGGKVDAFNTSKMSRRAQGDGDFDLEDMFSNVTSSLLRMADGAGNDYEGTTSDTAIFERSYLESLQSSTRNENFNKDILDDFLDVGRQLHTVYDELEDHEHIGVGGTLGNETFYRLTPEEFQQAKETYEFDPYEIDQPFAPNALNDIENELLEPSAS